MNDLKQSRKKFENFSRKTLKEKKTVILIFQNQNYESLVTVQKKFIARYLNKEFSL